MPYDPMFASSPGTGLAHPASYWAPTAGRMPADDGPAPAQAETEVAIIGGGYTGLSCACQLAREHGIRSIVLEANRPDWGCSGRNGRKRPCSAGTNSGTIPTDHRIKHEIHS